MKSKIDLVMGFEREDDSELCSIVSSGSGTPTSTPAKIGDIYVDTTNNHTYVAKGTSSSADWIKQNGSYALQANTISAANPNNSTSCYFGQITGLWTNTANYRKLYIPKSGTITNVYGMFQQTAGTSETSSLYIRVNNTTDYLISNSIVNNYAYTAFSNSSLNITVNEGDYIEFKWITPAWTTKPTNVYAGASINVDL